MTNLCIVPCGYQKIWHKQPDAGPTPAKDVYTGVFARKCQEYAIRFFPESYCILSAKYGFLWPDDIVPGPYEVTFKKQSTHPISIQKLKIIAVEKELMDFDDYVIVAGKEYVDIAKEIFVGKRIHIPLFRCKGNGVMMGKMTSAIRKGEPL